MSGQITTAQSARGDQSVFFHDSAPPADDVGGAGGGVFLDLLAAVFFVFMRAYDVAITEASIGAVLSTALYFFAIKRIEGQQEGKADEE